MSTSVMSALLAQFAHYPTPTTGGGIGIETIVWFVFGAIIVVGILALLWFAIGYAESKMPTAPPQAWNIVRVVFVLLVVFLLIAVLLGLLGHPIVRI